MALGTLPTRKVLSLEEQGGTALTSGAVVRQAKDSSRKFIYATVRMSSNLVATWGAVTT